MFTLLLYCFIHTAVPLAHYLLWWRTVRHHCVVGGRLSSVVDWLPGTHKALGSHHHWEKKPKQQSSERLNDNFQVALNLKSYRDNCLGTLHGKEKSSYSERAQGRTVYMWVGTPACVSAVSMCTLQFASGIYWNWMVVLAEPHRVTWRASELSRWNRVSFSESVLGGKTERNRQ